MIKKVSPNDEIAWRGNGTNNRRLHLNLRNVGTVSTWSTKYYCVPGTTMYCCLVFDNLVHDASSLHLHFMHLSNIVSYLVTLRGIYTWTIDCRSCTWNPRFDLGDEVGEKVTKSNWKSTAFVDSSGKGVYFLFPSIRKVLRPPFAMYFYLLCISCCHCVSPDVIQTCFALHVAW